VTTGTAATPLASRLSYAQCWEDWRVLGDALAVGPGDRVLSVASAGCNSLALALQGAHVVGIDLSPPQIALCELKLAGGALPYPRFLQLLGLGDGDPLDAYREIEPRLGADTKAFWRAHQDLLVGAAMSRGTADGSNDAAKGRRRPAFGILGAGKFERYLGTFTRRVLPLIHNPRRIQGLIDAKTPAEQRSWHDRRWSTLRWRGLFRVFFSRWVMARLGRSPEQFAQVQGSVAERILARCDAVLGGQDLADNPYVQWILEGAWRSIAVAHPYLTPAGHAGLVEAADRVRWVCASLEDHLPSVAQGHYTAFNLSNIGEYLPAPVWHGLYAHLLHAASPGARVAYWNLFVPRSCPTALEGRVERHPDRSVALLAQDRVPFYGAFVLETVR
jgi:S-adenosylmethionine-diacylglycerol 3-amino-3-carboxypropyl transferase